MKRSRCRLGEGALVFLLGAGSLAAQEPIRSFDRLSVEDGLSHSSVWSIAQDARGFLWFGTQEGLNRYDGYRFKVFRHDPEVPTTLAQSEVQTLYEDRDGVLWIGTRGGGLDRFQRVEESFVHHQHDPDDERSLSHDAVFSLLQDRDGTMWAGTEMGLDRLDPETHRFERYRPVADPALESAVNTLYEDSSGVLWVGTEAGLFRFDRASRSFTGPAAGLGHVNVTAVREDRAGQLWVAASSGLSRFDRATQTFVGHGFDAVYALLPDRRGDLWLGTLGHGAVRFDPVSGTLTTRYRHNPGAADSLSGDLVVSLFEDRTGVLWFGTYAGVSKYNPAQDRFASYRRQPGHEPTLGSNSIRAIHEDGAGVLWVGTLDQGLDRVDRKAGTVVHYRPEPAGASGLRHSAVTALAEDAAGVLWVGTWGGLHRFDREHERFEHHDADPTDPAALRSSLIIKLFHDSSQRLWVGTTHGLHHRDGEAGGFVRYPTRPQDPEGLGREPFYAIAEGASGTLWFGSDGGGLYRLDEDGGFERFRHDPQDASSLSGDKVAVIHEGRGAAIWVGTYNAGLNRMDPRNGSCRRYHRRDGLPSESVLGILEADDGRLWLSTSHGLSRFDPASETFSNYDAGDGLPGNVFATGSSFRSPRGEMFFGGIQGLTTFFPGDMESDPHPPVMTLTELYLANVAYVPSILETSRVVLSHRHADVAFEFAALHFANPGKNRYAYQLEGFDADWIESDASRRFARYTNLASGRYMFRLKGSTGAGTWSDEVMALELEMLPPPWHTWWAYGLYALAVVAAARFVFHVQQKRIERERAIYRVVERRFEERTKEVRSLVAELKAKNAELERFTYTVSHDLKSPLFTIEGFIAMAERDVDRGDFEVFEQDVARIRSAVRKMSKLLDDLLQVSRAGRLTGSLEQVSIAELAREAAELVAGQAAEKGVHIEVDPSLPVVRADRTRLLQVLQNLLANAVKFIGDRSDPWIEVGMSGGGGATFFYVLDNGIGIEPRDHEKVFDLFHRLSPERADTKGTGIGLCLAQRIVEAHGGRIWVESTGRGQGSKFCFTLSEARELDDVDP